MAKTMRINVREGGVKHVKTAPVTAGDGLLPKSGEWTTEGLMKLGMKQLREIAPDGVKDTSKHELINEMLAWQAAQKK